MKQIILLTLFLFSALSVARSQGSLRIDPPVYEENFVTEDLEDYWLELVMPRSITNFSGKNMNLLWVPEVTDAPTEWDFRVCDVNASYSFATSASFTTGTQQALPVPLAAGETTIIDLDLLPRQVAGCGEIQLHLFDAAFPGKALATANFTVCVSGDAAAAGPVNRESLRIFPNPASEHISLTKNGIVRQLWISNVLGKRVKTIQTNYNGRYDISDLPDGIYLVSMVDSRRNVLKTVRVSKRSIRP